MNHRDRFRIPLIITLLALGCFAAGLWVTFQAGCVGDSRTGALGDAAKALELEQLALWPDMLGFLLVVVVFALIPGRSASWRVLYGLAFVLLAVYAVQYAGAQFEAWGVQYCLRH
jgi:hypothetical protein